MLPGTIQVIKSVLDTDATLTPEERAWRLQQIQEPRPTGGANDSPDREKPIKVVSRAEAAKRLGDKTVHYVDKLVRETKLVRVTMPGRKRGTGILESSLESLIAGRSNN